MGKLQFSSVAISGLPSVFSKILIFKGRIIYILTNFVKKIFPKRNFPKLSFLIKVWLGNSEISLEMLKLGKLVLEFSFYEISSQMILPWTLFEPKIHLPKIELFADFRDLWQGRLLSLQTYKTWHICKSLYYCLLHIEAAMNIKASREKASKKETPCNKRNSNWIVNIKLYIPISTMGWKL